MSTSQANGAAKSACPPEVLKAIYGEDVEKKKEAYEESLRRWWDIYAERKMEDETEEYVANSLLYDKRHVPRTARAPDCVRDPAAPRPHTHGHGHGHRHSHSHGPGQHQQQQQQEGTDAAAT